MTKVFFTIEQLFYLLTDRRFLAFYLAMILTLAGLYIYLLHNSVFNLQARELALEETVRLETDIAVLETRSMALVNNINLDLAYNLGFAELATEPLFARRESSELVSLRFDDQI